MALFRLALPFLAAMLAGAGQAGLDAPLRKARSTAVRDEKAG
jgi:hypothetical protein